MKRLLKLCIVSIFALSLLLSLATVGTAAEMKTGIGVVTARGGLRLRAEASTASSILAVAPNGDSVVIIEQSGDWYKVNYNLTVGYMHGDYLTIKTRENIELGNGSVDGSVVNVRQSPTTQSGIVDQVLRGETVLISGFNEGWYKVEQDGVSGYIRSDLVALTEKPYGNKGTTVGSTGSNSGSTGANSGSNDSDNSSTGSNDSSNDSAGQRIATYAAGYVGSRYVYGGTTPSGFDCSGFVQYVYAHFGYRINRTATAQLADGYTVSRDSLQPGDIIYFGYGNTATHVGIYIGNGQFVHAENSSTGVVITDLSVSWYSSRYLTAHRIVD